MSDAAESKLSWQTGPLGFLAVALLAIAVYLPCLQNGFVYDDYLVIVSNHQILTPQYLKDLPTHDYFTTTGEASYRPFASLVYYLIAAACGTSAFAFHLVSILLHAAAAVLVVLLGRRTGLGRYAIWLGAAFAVHPLLSEAVCSINYSEDLLVTILVLAATLCATSSRLTLSVRIAAAAIFTALACLSKESGVMALPLILLTSLACDGKSPSRKQTAVMLLTSGIIVGAFLVIRFGLLTGLPQDVKHIGAGPIEIIGNSSIIISRYIGRMVFPMTLLADRIPVLTHDLSDWRIWLSLLGHLGLLSAGVVAWRKHRAISFGIFWFYLCIAPTSNLMAMSCPEADRYLYLSGIGLLLAATAAIRLAAGKWPPARPGLAVGCIGLLIMWTARTELRIPQWRNNYTLWTHEAAANPANAKACAEVAAQMNARSAHGNAREWAARAMALDPANAMAALQYAKADHAEGRIKEALKMYDAAIGSHRLHPHLESDAWLNYGLLLEEEFARTDDAAEAYRQSLALAPTTRAALRLGVILAQQGKTDEALAVWREAQALDPDNPALKINITIATQRAGPDKE